MFDVIAVNTAISAIHKYLYIQYFVNLCFLHVLFYLQQTEFLAIQVSVVIPMLLVLLMGRRTTKMSFTTYVTVFAYWFIIAVESGSMLEVLLVTDNCKHIILVTQAIACIAMIATNTYAMVTFCSFINPRSLVDTRHTKDEFHFIYIVLVCGSGMLFAEIPMLTARIHIVSVGPLLPGSFYLWLVKDIVFLGLIAMLAYVQRFGQKHLRIPCKPSFDSKDVFFQPEKRDRYISECRQARLLQSLNDDQSASSSSSLLDNNNVESSLTKCKSVPNISSCARTDSLALSNSKSTTCLDEMQKSYPQDDILENDRLWSEKTVAKLSKKPAPRTDKKKKKSHVSFKLPLNNGKFAQFKARSDSPPVIRDSNDTTL